MTALNCGSINWLKRVIFRQYIIHNLYFENPLCMLVWNAPHPCRRWRRPGPRSCWRSQSGPSGPEWPSAQTAWWGPMETPAWTCCTSGACPPPGCHPGSSRGSPWSGYPEVRKNQRKGRWDSSHLKRTKTRRERFRNQSQASDPVVWR